MSDITLTKREIELIRILSGKKGYMETDVLCDMMDIKPRTLRECIRQFRENHGDRTGVRITAGIGTGYKLEIIDQEKYHTLLKSMLETETASQFLMPVDQEDRVSYIIRLLLTADDWRKSEDIAEQMYISRSTFAEDLRQVRNRLAKMNLSLASAPRRGIRIEGDEISIRNAIAEYCFQLSDYEEGQVKMLSGYFDEETMEMVRKTLYDLLREYDFTMSDASFRNLVIHLLIAMNRIHSGTYISSLEVNQLNLRDTKEWKIACELYRRLSETTGLSIPSAEIGYVTIHLRGKRIISDEAEMIMYPETLNLLTTVMKAVEERYGIDFTGDIELYSALAMHL